MFVGLAALTMWAVHMLANRVSCQDLRVKSEKKTCVASQNTSSFGAIHVQIVPKGCFFFVSAEF